jgi:dTDP-4-amino-4,6-dideoxygalactose transaminase
MTQKILFMDLKSEYSLLKPEIDQAIQRVVDSGWFILGPELKNFENEFAAYCGSQYGVGVGSGTDAIYLALKALDIGPGDEVITVSHTFIATALAITFTGAIPVFVDIDPKTYTIDPNLVREAVSTRTKAIIPVHLYGQMADMDPIMEIANQYHLAVVEDACQAHGAVYKGRKAGTIGHIGCFSFYPTKNLGAYGDGGALITQDPHLDERLRSLRNYGQEKKYYHKSIGTNSRLDEIQAALLRVKLKYLDSSNIVRQNIARKYSQLKDIKGIQLPSVREDCSHIFHIYAICSEKRDKLKEYLDKNSIDTLIHYPVPVHLQQAYASSPKITLDLRITEKVAQQILSLPMFPALSHDQQERIIFAIRSFFE